MGIVVHELRHYYDSLNPPPSLSSTARRAEPALLEKKWEEQSHQLQEDDFKTLESTPEGQKFMEARLKLANAGASVDESAESIYDRAESTFKDEYLDLLHNRFFYLDQECERLAYREQVRYLRDDGHLSKEEVLRRMTHATPEIIKSAIKVILKTGEVVPLIIPPMPHDLRYFSALYDLE